VRVSLKTNGVETTGPAEEDENVCGSERTGGDGQ